MDKYFRVKEGSKLYNDYFAYIEDSKKVNEAFGKFADKHGIEAKEYYPYRNLGIVYTKNDYERFKSQLKKNSQFYKLKSEINKEWGELTKDLKFIHKPHAAWYLRHLTVFKTRSRLFAVDKDLYGSIEADGNFDTEDWMEEMKGSEFFKIIEDFENKKIKEEKR